jgi:ParB family chromosome partitioning protein
MDVYQAIEVSFASEDGLRAEFAEIDENLIRNELTVLERGEYLARQKEIYEALHPEAKEYARKSYGGKKRHGLAGETVSQADSFATDTAAKTGLTPRTIQSVFRPVLRNGDGESFTKSFGKTG